MCQTANNGMHPTADTAALIYIESCGGVADATRRNRAYLNPALKGRAKFKRRSGASYTGFN
jgi:hypothetical protein